MALDALCLAAALRELRSGAEGGRIDKIYQPGSRDVHAVIRQDSRGCKSKDDKDGKDDRKDRTEVQAIP